MSKLQISIALAAILLLFGTVGGMVMEDEMRMKQYKLNSQ